MLGAAGPPGPAGPGLQRTGFMVVRHSQSAQVPDCPSGMVKLWDGYSLLMMQGNDHGYHQDLGKNLILLNLNKIFEFQFQVRLVHVFKNFLHYLIYVVIIQMFVIMVKQMI